MALYRVAPYYHYIYDGALLENPQGWRDFWATLINLATNLHEYERIQKNGTVQHIGVKGTTPLPLYYVISSIPLSKKQGVVYVKPNGLCFIRGQSKRLKF